MRVLSATGLLVIATCTVARAAGVGCADGPWRPPYEEAAKHTIARRLLNGYPDLTMRPLNIATRYEWAASLGRLALYYDLPCTQPEYLPVDVPWDHWCAGSARLLTGVGLYIGPRGGPLMGDRPLLRAEFARTAWALMQALQGVIPPPVGVNDLFDHKGQVTGALSEAGVLQPYSDGQYHLERPMPRWQVCVGVYRLVLWNQARGGPPLYGPQLYGKERTVRP